MTKSFLIVRSYNNIESMLDVSNGLFDGEEVEYFDIFYESLII